MNQTERTFIVTGIVVTLLLLMHLLPTFSIGGTTFRSVNILHDLFYGTKTGEQQDVIPRPTATKSLLTEQKKSTTDAPFKEIIPPGVTMIEDFSNGNAGGMEHFYEMLAAKGLNRPVRIAYFGDSFIEGDIYTSDLREMLQEKFGGCGPGWIDAGSFFNKGFRTTIIQEYSGIEEFQIVKKPFNIKVQGLNQRYFVPSEGAKVSTWATNHKEHASNWQTAHFFFLTEQGMTITSRVGGVSTTYQASGSKQIQAVETKGEAKYISHSFSNVRGTNYLYGMALESEKGVVLDCYSMRGSAGFTLAYIPQGTLCRFAELRPIDLFIIHFGLNVISPKSTSASIRHYCKQMEQVVEHLQSAFPYASFLIVSVSDRDQRTENGITTMKGVEEMVSCQQEMATVSGTAFFNLFSAMGGRGSMKKLVEQGYANKDYTHINLKGGEFLAEHLFKSLVAGYDNYVRRKSMEK